MNSREICYEDTKNRFVIGYHVNDNYGKCQRFYVSPQGKDSNNGTRQAPFATLQRAQKAVRDLNMRKEAVNVYLYPGNYRIDRTLVLVKKIVEQTNIR